MIGGSRKKPAAKVTPAQIEEQELDRIVQWRLGQFESAGLCYPLALELAITRSVDSHKVLDAIRAGADHDLIVRIFL